MNKEQETVWIEASRNGDIQAFGKLAKAYQDMIYTLAYRLLNNQHDAEDLCQEVLLKIFRTIGQYKATAPFGAWVYRITYNESINRIRKLKRNKESYNIDTNLRENWVETSNVLNNIEEREKKKILLSALNKLPEEDRLLIMGYYFEELAVKELVEMTRLSESNIKIKLYRSRKFLFQILSVPSVKEKLL
ncbi:MAG: RNA polymerase sigma factor [Bacteroidia bacterium]|nr:RNA polymerase sigma factor [Bacteroidia bacterium]